MHRYEVTMSVVVEADTEWEAYYRATSGEYRAAIVEEDGIRRLADPIPYVLTHKGEATLKEHA